MVRAPAALRALAISAVSTTPLDEHRGSAPSLSLLLAMTKNSAPQFAFSDKSNVDPAAMSWLTVVQILAFAKPQIPTHVVKPKFRRLGMPTVSDFVLPSINW
jgi:hypothetical protein